MYNNPILQRPRNNVSQQQNPQLAQLRQLVQMYKNSPNQTSMIQNMLEQIPGFDAAQQLVRSNGGNGQQVFYALAQQMGADPQEVLDSLGI